MIICCEIIHLWSIFSCRSAGEEGFVISTINFVAEAPGGFVPDSKSRSTIHESVNIPVPVNRISSASPTSLTHSLMNRSENMTPYSIDVWIMIGTSGKISVPMTNDDLRLVHKNILQYGHWMCQLFLHEGGM